jgi:MFS family permease
MQALVHRRPGDLHRRVSGACRLANSAAMLIGARLVEALGAAILVPTSLALLVPLLPMHRRASPTTIWARFSRGRGRCGAEPGRAARTGSR